MRCILDRIEENMAVLEAEDRSIVTLPREQLPADAQPGDVLHWEDGQFTLLQEETRQRRQRIREKMNRLWK